METFVKYPGGKNKELPIINKYKPIVINRYFEPFLGSGAVYFSINIKNSYINDKSEDLYNMFSYIKEQNEEFKCILEKIDDLWRSIEKKAYATKLKKLNLDINLYQKYYVKSFNRKQMKINKLEEKGFVISDDDKKSIEITSRKTAIYMLIRDKYNDKNESKVFHTACFYFIREYCYSSMFRFSKDGNFNVPYGGKSYNYKYITSKLKRMFSNSMEYFLSNTEIFNLDYVAFLNKFSFDKNDFIFLDPPYDSEFSTYDNNFFDRNEQIRLRNYLENIEASWMLIIKKTDFIYNLYKKFNILEYNMKYMVSFKNRNNRDVEHLIITNYVLEDKK